MLQNVVANYGDGSNIWRNLVSLWCCVCVDSLSLFLLSFSIFASTSLSLSLSLFSSFNSILIWFSLYYIFWWNAYRKSNKFHILDDFVCVEFSFFVFFLLSYSQCINWASKCFDRNQLEYCSANANRDYDENISFRFEYCWILLYFLLLLLLLVWMKTKKWKIIKQTTKFFMALSLWKTRSIWSNSQNELSS